MQLIGTRAGLCLSDSIAGHGSFFDSGAVCDSWHATCSRVWAGLRLWPKFDKFVEQEVQARQELNAEHAVSLALRDGITWLLHCDADELFYSPSGPVIQHFNRLTADRITVRPRQCSVPVYLCMSQHAQLVSVTCRRMHLEDTIMTCC